MKRIMTLVVLALFLVSLVPVFAHENEINDGGKVDVQAKAKVEVKGLSEFGKNVSTIQKLDVSVKERHEKLREAFMEAKEKFVDARKEFLASKASLKVKHDEVKSKCKDEASDGCKKSKEEFMGKEAKSHLLHALDVMDRVLEKREAKLEDAMENADAEAKLELQAELDEVSLKLSAVAEMRTKVEAAKTKDEIKALNREIRDLWNGVKSNLEKSRGTVMSHRFAFALHRAESLEAKLEKVLDKMKERGQDTLSIQAEIDSFNSHITKSKELTAQARAKFTSKEAGTTEALVKEGHKLLVEAHKELKLAHQDLKDIVSGIKTKGDVKAKADLEDASEETEVEVEASGSANVSA